MKRRIRIGVLLNLALSLLFAATAISVTLYVHRWVENIAEEEAEAKARILLDHNLAIHAYFNRDLKPLLMSSKPLDLKNDFEPSWMSSTYAVRKIQGYFRELTELPYYYKESAINARTPENEADPHEQEFLEKLNTDPKITGLSQVRSIDGEPQLVILRRGEKMGSQCLRCHDKPEQAPSGLVALYGGEKSFGRHEGETVSAISTRIPLSEAHKRAKQAAVQLTFLLLAAFVCLFIAQLYLHRKYFFHPLAVVRAKAKEIAESTEHLGDEIPTGPGEEFHELGAAFNQMSKRLRDERDRLEERVKERTEHLAMAEAESKEAREQLFHSSKLAALGTFAAGIAHEVNNPLSIILGNIAILHEKLNGRPGHEEETTLLKRQAAAARRIAEIVSGVRSFARSEQDSPSPTSLHGAIREALGMVESFYATHEILLEKELNAQEDLVIGTPGQLQHIILNLLTNSKDAIADTKRGGRIRVETLNRPGQVVLRVSDNGGGIPEEIGPRIFEPFFTTKAPGMGTGLGLSITHSIAKSMNGSISFRSSRDGTVFEVLLPVVENAIKLTSTFLPTDDLHPINQLTRISGCALIVDDEEEIRVILAHHLSQVGIRIREAANGKEALSILAKERYDFVLTDLRMPEMSGYEMIAEARKAGVSAQFIVITGSDLGDVQSSSGFSSPESRPDGYIQKPFSSGDILKELTKRASGPSRDLT